MEINQLVTEIRNKFQGKNIFLLWSGGNDSNLLLNIILHNEIYKNCNLNVITFLTPSHVYNRSNLYAVKNTLCAYGIIFDIIEPESEIPYSIQPSKACSLCKKIRRKSFREYYLPRKHYGDLVVTGHSLSDLTAYYAEMCIFKLQGNPVTEAHERFLEVANKFLPMYKTEIGVSIYRPLLVYSQEFILQHLKLCGKRNNIDIMEKDCLWKNQRKRLLQEYFIKMNTVSSYSQTYSMFKSLFGFPSESEFLELSFDTYLV